MGDTFSFRKVKAGRCARTVVINDSSVRLGRLTRMYTPVMRVNSILSNLFPLSSLELFLGYAMDVGFNMLSA